MSRLVKTRLEICKNRENRKNLLEDPYENSLDNAFMLGNSIQYDFLEFNDYDYSLSDEMELNIMKKEE
ncbi:hypothetical protein GCK72_004861 [Caenorhabditis remanei]|uniref:Uncharacterized protein n=1 Tax=Caenorhabditis remanei TaxID=31234 RepID=A0A6A5HAQ6_CAERE|nr:hypothetical protein GCK72_004861 [Caenorhabditis remanei]KAF1764910.1 hypothetical protein GCK72_004861 [Caenorhabditis remanei]